MHLICYSFVDACFDGELGNFFLHLFIICFPCTETDSPTVACSQIIICYTLNCYIVHNRNVSLWSAVNDLCVHMIYC